MSDLHRLIYVSAAVDGSDVDIWALSSILNAAERNNLQYDISGLLLAHDGAFCQVLEGPRAALDGLMTILGDDRRHAGIRVLSDQPVETRYFGKWAMAQVVASDVVVSELEGVRILDLSGDGALDILRRAARRMIDVA